MTKSKDFQKRCYSGEFFKQFYHLFVDKQLKMEVLCDDVKTLEEIRSYLQNSIFDGLQYFHG